MRVLLSLVHSDGSGLNQARRENGYDRLVLFTSDPKAAAVATILSQENGATSNPDLRPRLVKVDPYDVAVAMKTMQAEIDALKGHTLSFNVAGEPMTLVHAAVLTCLRNGIQSWFYLHGRVARVPILTGTKIAQRFTDAEVAMMRALAADSLVPPAKLGANGLQRDRLLHGLRTKGLVRLVNAPRGVEARFTPEGQYYMQQIRTMDRGANGTQATASLVEASHPHPPKEPGVELLRPLNWPAAASTQQEALKVK